MLGFPHSHVASGVPKDFLWKGIFGLISYKLDSDIILLKNQFFGILNVLKNIIVFSTLNYKLKSNHNHK